MVTRILKQQQILLYETSTSKNIMICLSMTLTNMLALKFYSELSKMSHTFSHINCGLASPPFLSFSWLSRAFICGKLFFLHYSCVQPLLLLQAGYLSIPLYHILPGDMEYLSFQAQMSNLCMKM